MRQAAASLESLTHYWVRYQPIEDALRERFQHVRFGSAALEVNYTMWAELTVATGYDLAWAVEWIEKGYTEPPRWMRDL